MAGEGRKDFNAMLQNNKDMPKMRIVTDPKTIEKFGGCKMYFAPPIDYDHLMKKIPYGKVITLGEIREYLAKQNGADFTEPMTAGIFTNIAAWASDQRDHHKTPYWRTLKADGELNPKYPGGIFAQKAQLEAEGHTVIQKGRKNPRCFVANYERVLYTFESDHAEMIDHNPMQEAVNRIKKMECFFDFITDVLQNKPEMLHVPAVQETIKTLSDYYASDDWLHDYEMDEQHLLPCDLKRGVLSQDGLYNLLCDIRNNH